MIRDIMGKDKETKIMIVLFIIVIISVILAIFFYMSDKDGEGTIGFSWKKEQPNAEQPANNDPNYYAPTEEEIARANELANILKESFPKLNGSSYTIPLEATAKAEISDKSQEENEIGISHSTEDEAFEDLLGEKCDAIFVSHLSDEQEMEAAAKNIDLTSEVVAREGLAIVVNSSNPVNDITSDQLADIFTGKIKNWKDVGGNDEKIEVYHNKKESGTYEYMQELMLGTPMIEGQTELVPGETDGINEVEAVYSNAKNAIGYMTYKYPASTYGNDIKFLKIDDVEPNRETMTANNYPLIYDIYIVYNRAKSNENNSNELAEWLTTYTGQNAVMQAGYIPKINIKTTNLELSKYSINGTGKEKKEDTKPGSFRYVPASKNYEEKDVDGTTIAIRYLKNEELQTEINQFIRTSTENLQGIEKNYDQFVALLTNATKEGLVVETECKNGYLSVQVILSYDIGRNRYIYDGYSKVYDLVQGKEISFSDMYYKDIDFVSVINEQIETIIRERNGLDASAVKEKRKFAGITENNILYGLDKIAFTKNNPYFEDGVIFDLNTYFENIFVINEERNMEGIWEERVNITKEVVTHNNNASGIQIGNIDRQIIENFIYFVFYSNTNNDEIDEKIKGYINIYVDNEKIIPLVNKTDKTKYVLDENENIQITISVTTLGTRYAIIELGLNPKNARINLGTITLNLETGESANKKDIAEWKTTNGVEE